MSKKSDALDHVANAALSKALPFAPPWVVAGGAWPLAHLIHSRFGASPWTTVGMTLGDVALTGLTWHLSSKRSALVRAMSSVSVSVGIGWLAAAAIEGVNHAIDNIYLLVGGGLALSWNLKHATRNMGSGSSDGGLLEKIGLAKSKIRSAKVEPNKVTIDLQLPPGELTADDAVKARGRIASVTSVAENGVRVVPNRNHFDRATITVVPEDLLSDAPVWPGPSAPGATMVDALVWGKYEDWVDAQLWAAANPRLERVLAHLLLIGQTGTGKGVVARDLIAEILTRRECSIWAIDIVKRMQTLGSVASALDWFATKRAEAEALLDTLPEVIAARTDFLASRNMDNWVPGCGLNFLVVWVEEFASILRDLDKFVDAANAARSAGVWIVLSGQRATHDNLPTSVRNALSQVICLGVKDDMEASIALGDELVAQGANPAAWGTSKPGYAYATGPGIDKDRFLVPARSFGQPFSTDATKLAEVADAYAHLRDPLDQVTAMAAGKAYRERTRYDVDDTAQTETVAPAPAASAAAAPAAPTHAAPAPAGAVPTQQSGANDMDEVDEMDIDPLADEPREVREHVMVRPMAEDEDTDADLLRQGLKLRNADLPAAPAFRFDGQDPDEPADEEPSISKEEAEALVDAAIRAVLAEGRDEVRPADLEAALAGKRSRAWVAARIVELCTLRVLEKVGTGRYRIREAAAERELAGV